MRKVLFRSKALSDIHTFSDGLAEFYRKFYTDTGLENEDEIVERYLASARTMFQEGRTGVYSEEIGCEIGWKAKRKVEEWAVSNRESVLVSP